MAKSKETKAKEPVRIRFKKLANGNQSIYLDIYKSGQRVYEFLKLYIVPETDAYAKKQNAATMEAANYIKSQRIMDITNDMAGIKYMSSQSRQPFVRWLEQYSARQAAMGLRKNATWINSVIKAIKMFRPNVLLKDVNRDFCVDFMEYMISDYRTYKGKHPAKATVSNYLSCIKSAMNLAVEKQLVRENPMKTLNISHLKGKDSKREYLTIEEVKKLIATPFEPYEDTKKAFLFSCFCGLRISDVRELKWKNVVTEGDETRIEILQFKTKKPLYLPLNKNALRWMPERGDKTDEDNVFPKFRKRSFDAIADWAMKAGINKHITYHCSRHTFATMELTMGADLFTTSKLLGHYEVRTTQIYAQIINSKKHEAVSLLDNAFEE